MSNQQPRVAEPRDPHEGRNVNVTTLAQAVSRTLGRGVPMTRDELAVELDVDPAMLRVAIRRAIDDRQVRPTADGAYEAATAALIGAGSRP